VGAEVQHSVGLKDLLQEGVVGGEAVVGGGGSAEQQPHGIALIPEGGLHPNEDVAKLAAVDQQVISVAVQVACTSNLPWVKIWRNKNIALMLLGLTAVTSSSLMSLQGLLWPG